jgi:hypothetical protein
MTNFPSFPRLVSLLSLQLRKTAEETAGTTAFCPIPDPFGDA